MLMLQVHEEVRQASQSDRRKELLPFSQIPRNMGISINVKPYHKLFHARLPNIAVAGKLCTLANLLSMFWFGLGNMMNDTEDK